MRVSALSVFQGRKIFSAVWLIYFMSFISPFSVSAAEKEKIFIVFTGEDLGRLEPCGCASGQLGGLSRRHTWLDHFKADHTGSIVLLSNGDLIRDIGRQDEIKFTTLIQAMNEMNYQAVNLGEKELQFGADYLKGVSQGAAFPFLSANIQDSNKDVVFAKTFDQEAVSSHSCMIRVIGLIDPVLVDQSGGFHASEIEESLHPLLSGSVKDTVKIVLYHGSEDSAVKWAKAFPEIDLWISGHDKEEPEAENAGSPVVCIPKEGKYIGVAAFEFDEDKKRFSLKEIRFYGLDESIEDSNKIKTLLNNYEATLKSEKLAQSEEGRWETGGLHFTGTQACASCHAPAYAVWSISRHSHAFKDLKKKNKSFDPDCLVCHSTGFKYKGGFTTANFTPHLAHVGCESCHGMGSQHIKDPAVNSMKKPGRETCVTCHDIENSPHFDFDSYWEKIKHS